MICLGKTITVSLHYSMSWAAMGTILEIHFTDFDSQYIVVDSIRYWHNIADTSILLLLSFFVNAAKMIKCTCKLL